MAEKQIGKCTCGHSWGVHEAGHRSRCAYHEGCGCTGYREWTREDALEERLQAIERRLAEAEASPSPATPDASLAMLERMSVPDRQRLAKAMSSLTPEQAIAMYKSRDARERVVEAAVAWVQADNRLLNNKQIPIAVRLTDERDARQAVHDAVAALGEDR
jgi:hypothetical protein